jgi:hypothetical protein
MNLEAFLRAGIARNVIDFAIRAQKNSDGRVSFYIHPARESGDTADFVVRENDLTEGPWQKPQQGGFLQHIILNCRDVTWPNNTISYEELVEMVYPGQSAEVFTVTYYDRASGVGGSLVRGAKLDLIPFLIVNVDDTSNA